MIKSDATYKNKSVKELAQAELTLRAEIAKVSLEAAAATVKDTNATMKKRKSLAYVLTLLTQKRELEKLQQVKKE